MTRYGLPITTFGSYEWKIHRLLARDPDFRSLCEEHEMAHRALERFRGSGASPRRIAEYIVLIDELRQEILQELKRSEKKDSNQ